MLHSRLDPFSFASWLASPNGPAESTAKGECRHITVLWLEEHGEEERGRILPRVDTAEEEHPEERRGRVSRSSVHSDPLKAKGTPTRF